MAQATFDQYLRLGAMIKDGSLDREKVQAIIEGRIEFPREPQKETITVPKLSASWLIETARTELNLKEISNCFNEWDFLTDECGKTYEVKTWKFDSEFVSTAEIREQFTGGFEGNTAAFISWVIKRKPEGRYASIPTDDKIYYSSSENGRRPMICAAHFFNRGDHLGLHMCNAVTGGVHAHKWHGDTVFVAFRELKKT